MLVLLMFGKRGSRLGLRGFRFTGRERFSSFTDLGAGITLFGHGVAPFYRIRHGSAVTTSIAEGICTIYTLTSKGEKMVIITAILTAVITSLIVCNWYLSVWIKRTDELEKEFLDELRVTTMQIVHDHLKDISM